MIEGKRSLKDVISELDESFSQMLLRLIDAISTAAKFGISSDRAVNYNADSQGTRLNYEAVSHVVSELRESRPITNSWKAEIENDFIHRSKNGRSSR